MYKSPIELLRHIYDECLFIENAVKPEMTSVISRIIDQQSK